MWNSSRKYQKDSGGGHGASRRIHDFVVPQREAQNAWNEGMETMILISFVSVLVSHFQIYGDKLVS